jgi:hypothetical protein
MSNYLIQGYRELASVKLGAKSASFTASYFPGDRFSVHPKRLVYSSGPEDQPHLRLMRTEADIHPVTNDRRAFFADHGINSDSAYALAVYSRRPDGSLQTSPEWHALDYKRPGAQAPSLFDSLRGRYRLAGLNMTKITDERIDKKTGQLAVTQITSKIPFDLPIEQLSGAYSLGQLRAWLNPKWELYDHTTVDRDRRVIQVHFRCHPLILPDGTRFEAPPAMIELNLAHVGLPADVFDSIYTGRDKRYRAEMVTFEERPDHRTERWTSDDDPSIRPGSYNDDYIEGEPTLFFEFSTCREVAIPLPEKIEADDERGERVKLVQVQGAIRAEHLDGFNGRQAGAVEWIPSDQKFPRGYLTDLHFNSDPSLPDGADFRSGRLLMSLSGQCFSADVTKEVYDKKSLYTRVAQWFTIFDQLLFFGQRLLNLLSWPYGPISHYVRPWWVQTKGCASIIYGKAISTWEAICTGSNFVVRALWKHLFARGYYGLKGFTIRGTMPDHYPIITEDANTSFGAKDYFGYVIRFTTLTKAVATSVSRFIQAMLQRGRWLASILAYLATSFFYLRDAATSVIFVNALLSRLSPAFKPMVSLFKSFGEWLDRFNTNGWYIDSIKQLFISNFPALNIFFGYKPLVAGASFLVGPWIANFIAWAAYGNQSTKTGQNPKYVLPPWPRFIHMWTFLVPYVARNALHAENVGSGQFGVTSDTEGVKVPDFAKRQAFMNAGIGLGAGLWGFTKLAYQMEVLTPEVTIPSALLIAAGLGIQLWWEKASERYLGNEDERNWWRNLADASFRAVNFLGTMAGTAYVLKTYGHADWDSFSASLFMQSFWSVFNGGGWLSGIRAYLVEQQYHRDEANRQYAHGLIDVKTRDAILSGSDTTGSFLSSVLLPEGGH